MSTAQDLPVPVPATAGAAPALRLVPTEPLDFDEAVRSIRPRLHRYAIRRLGDVHEAEELVQEALLRAYSHREQLLTEDDLGAWATVVTGRLVIDRLRVRGRSTSVADVPEGSRVGRDTADVVVARDEARVALDALDAMPARQAALLWAREVEGQSYDELCVRFSMTEPAVRSVLTRARKALRKEYALRGGTLPAGGLAVIAPWLTGLTFAEKLRRVAGRLATPAALGTAGIATLGGLLFSPYGELPGHQAPAAPLTPSHAVVLERRDVAPKPTAPVVLGSQSSRHAKPADTGGNGGFPVVGCPSGYGPVDGTCERNQTVEGKALYVDVPLPDNPTGIHYVVLNSNKFECDPIPTNPLLKCRTQDAAPTQQGASK